MTAEGVGKCFEIYRDDRSRFFEFFGRRKHHQTHWALRDLSFTIPRGGAFGVIGSNGAGKSTLLKLIAGISQPSEGRLTVRAPVTTLLDLGLGFHETFSGRENIYLNCTLMGMRREEVDALLPEIVHFAELGPFIDLPVRTYSSGMVLRLGFAVAAHTASDIFLVDEVLTVGDEYFQRKCVRKIEALMARGCTIILVSHDLHAVRSICDQVLWLDQGGVQALGDTRQVVDSYLDLHRERVGEEHRTRPDLRPIQGGRSGKPLSVQLTEPDPHLKSVIQEACALPDAQALWLEQQETEAYERYDGEMPVVIGSGEVRIQRVRILDESGRERKRFRTGEALSVAVTFRTTEPVPRPILGIALHRNDGVYVYGPNTRFDGVFQGSFHGIYTFFIHYPSLLLLSGTYRVSVAVFDEQHLHPHVWYNQMFELEVVQEVEDHGLVQLPHSWGLITHWREEGEFE